MALVQTDLKSPIAGDSERWPKLKLVALHEQAWGETKTTMLWAVPAFSDIWLGMMVDKDHEQAWFTDCIDTAATDDKFLYINPSFFFKLTLDERLFVNSHEIEHAMYGHAGLFYRLQKQGHITYSDGVKLPVDNELLNFAADYVINDQLVVGKVGVMPKGCLHWPEVINGDMDVLLAYRILWDVKKGGGKVNNTTKPGEGKPCEGGGKPWGKCLRPGQGRGKPVEKAMAERSQVEWDGAVQAAMNSAKLKGQLPANFERLFTKRLSPKADWRDLFALAVSKRIGNDRYTWSMLDQQLMFRKIGIPGRTQFGCELVVIVVDTSGSINQPTFDMFMAEAQGLMEQAKPKRIIFVQCDTDIQQWVELDASCDLYECKLIRGGGTSFKEPFERVEQEGLEPDLLVYLTDLYGDQHEIRKPNYPVVWAAVGRGQQGTPWGELVDIPEQATREDA